VSREVLGSTSAGLSPSFPPTQPLTIRSGCSIHRSVKLNVKMGPSAKMNNNSGNVQRSDKLLKDGREEAKMEFMELRTGVLEALSDSYKRKFGEIVFAKWKKEFLPALILSPFSVPPGPVRTLWMEKFEKVLICVNCCSLFGCSSDPLFSQCHLSLWYL
jgi:hypothetical protein